MKSADFPGTNRVLTPPAGMDNCEPLHVLHDGVTCMSQWEMTGKEIAQLIVSRRICLQVVGDTHPPVALFVLE